MQKIKPWAGVVAALFHSPSEAVTIDDMAVKNNKIIELDQEIAIAEKNKKLAELKGSYLASEPTVLPAPISAPLHQEESMIVIAVHGAPANPIVDVQYGEALWQRRRGDTLPNGWEIAEVDAHSVTFKKTGSGKHASVLKKISIGRPGFSMSDDDPSASAAAPGAPNHTR